MMYINKTLSQNSDESITKDGVYDLTRFSKHESDIVQIVLNNVMEDYPPKLRSIGLCNEAHGILYKPRYVLFETIVQVFGDSQYYVDLFAVALAYAEKGSGYREKAIRYFEEAEPYLTEDFLNTLGQFTRNYTQTVKRAADNKRRYAPGWVHSTCLLRGFPKGAAPHLAHDFAEQSVVCYTLCRRCPENTVAAGEGKGI